ncbi:MAG TPA: hypothetical protein H9858_00525 [Candidatus Blautia stercoravium]|nr:hypothetical protein [Candidatus Blautia stercoravium]
MAQLSEKELSALNDLLADEELLTKKFSMLAKQTDDTEIKQKFEQISQQHQGHFNSLYEFLK